MNATKYEAALFVDESTHMVAEGTYLFTIGIILDTLDISTVISFYGAVSGSGTAILTAIQVAEGVDELVVSTQAPLPVGVYTCSISLIVLDFDNPDAGVSHVTEAEVRVLPPPRKCVCALHCIVYILTSIYVHNIVLLPIHKYSNEYAFEGKPLTAQRCIVIVANMRYIQYVFHF